ncbi:hypothetical protein GC093_25685 [Paenibacillus sp. LMG 31456]|uniref:Uncharacterized protein n=1 Tax=Paenibacillus foliorum TaxID=2654974 RepID=A0A972H574_9BACL|nr:hypothetical protein [Paenibacillus foliorum]NOU96586.1 hypothetical protein [Paenibacillus foliorum]
MEKYKPMQMPMHHVQMPAPNMSAPNMQMPVMQMPNQAPMPVHHITAPINLHASYEEINIYEPKKEHHHGHGHYHKPVGWSSVGTILVLYILLVIILRSTCK